MRLPALLLTMLALVAASFGACGANTAAPAASGPATLVPTDAVVYGEATLDPDEDRQQALDALLAKFPGGKDLGATLRKLIDRGLRESDTPLSYNDDIKPWIGDKAAVFVGSFGLSFKPREIGVLLATTDGDASMAAIEKAEPKRRNASYEAHDYVLVDDHGTQLAVGVVDDWLVLGTVEAFKGAVIASRGEGLADTNRYAKALAGADEDRLGFVYMDVRAFADLARSMPGGAAALQGLKGALDQPIVVTVSADADGAQVAADVPASAAAATGGIIGQGSKLIGAVPADAWLAIGQPKLGKVLDSSLDQLTAQLGGRDAIERGLRGATGLGLDDVLGWMGDFSIFVRGESVAGLGGALVIETTDEAASARTLKALARLARSAGDGTRVLPLGVPGEGFALAGDEIPQRVSVFQRDGHVVIAYGEDAARDAIDAPEKLGDADAFKAASESLGDGYDVSTWVAIAPILKLVDSTGTAQDADWQQAKPYLEPLGALILGAKKDGDRLSSVGRITVP